MRLIPLILLILAAGCRTQRQEATLTGTESADVAREVRRVAVKAADIVELAEISIDTLTIERDGVRVSAAGVRRLSRHDCTVAAAEERCSIASEQATRHQEYHGVKHEKPAGGQSWLPLAIILTITLIIACKK